MFCDKEGLAAELKVGMEAAEKKAKGRFTKDFEARRQALERSMVEIAGVELPRVFTSFAALHAELKPELAAIEACCRRNRAALASMPADERQRGDHCRIFYDGTGDDLYSNFKSHRFAVGAVGFMKGEQFFHVSKALLCRDTATAVKMMTTTGGPALRSLGRTVANYNELGADWEDVDSGLLLLVNMTIKLAAFSTSQLPSEAQEANARLCAELIEDGARGVYIVEGAKDDARCGIGIHATEPDVLERIEGWGRNQLGHACIAVARYMKNTSQMPGVGCSAGAQASNGGSSPGPTCGGPGCMATLEQLDSYLARKTYLGSDVSATLEDCRRCGEIPAGSIDAGKLPHLYRWHTHVSFLIKAYGALDFLGRPLPEGKAPTFVGVTAGTPSPQEGHTEEGMSVVRQSLGGVPVVMKKFREIRAIHDADTVRVYQAYNEQIAEAAVTANSFLAPLQAGLWSSTRMTWVKPSAVWMAYRCGWTIKKDKNQARVLALDVSRSGFEKLLMGARLSHGEDPGKCKAGTVVVQWDPERRMCPWAPEKDVLTQPMPRVRSIQIGLRGQAVQILLDPKFVRRITDVTSMFVKAAEALEASPPDLDAAAVSLWPDRVEEEMAVPHELRVVLGMDCDSSSALLS